MPGSLQSPAQEGAAAEGQSASRALAEAWTRLGDQTERLNRSSSTLGKRAAAGNQGSNPFSRSQNSLQGGAHRAAGKQVKTQQKSVPKTRGTGGGGRRGRR